jgi:alkanesulfonate monooxygenase SsuD/methylene tetrahydromethanopterin reductase-like flavin-dependent oxidoreductase (luciferase family)
LKIGLFLTAQFPAGGATTEEVDRILGEALAAEASGLDSIFLGHHYLARSAFLQPVSLIGYLAAATSRVQLGLGVYLASLHNPVALAEELATLDVLSRGRLIAGLGAGYREVEYRALGVPYEQRFKRLEEAVEVMRALWGGEAVTRTGLFGTIEKAKLVLRPAQPGGPPLWLGAFGPQGIARAARLNTPWLIPPDGDRAALKDRFADYRKLLGDSGQDLRREYPLLREVAVAETRAEAEQMAIDYLAPLYRQYRNWEAARAVSLDDLVNSYALVGTPDDVAAQLSWYATELGATHVICRTAWPGMPAGQAKRAVELLGASAAIHVSTHRPAKIND